MKKEKTFAIPTVNKVLTPHFGHCEQFAIVETEDNSIVNIGFIEPPVHQPGVYPRFLAEQGVNVIISGGMGLVEQYLRDQLQTGENLCDH